MDPQHLAYFGTYHEEMSLGIYAVLYDTAWGKSVPLGLASEMDKAWFLAVHPNHRFLYAVSLTNEYEGRPGGSVSAFEIDGKTGKLTLLNTVRSGGGAPCHLNVDRTGRCLVIANYLGGSLAAFPIQSDGRLGEASALVQHSGSGPDHQWQAGPRPHSVDFSPDDRFLLSADMGLDTVFVYRADAAHGTLVANAPALVKIQPGAGPRHFAFHVTGRHGYVINQLQSTVTAFAYAADRGALRELQTISTLPKHFSGENAAAEIEVHPSGQFLYGSNRGHDSIAVFAIDGSTGTLNAVEHVSAGGKEPTSFGIDPAGSHLLVCNLASDNVVVFRIDKTTGRLTPTGEEIPIPAPVCVRFVPRNCWGRGGASPSESPPGFAHSALSFGSAG